MSSDKLFYISNSYMLHCGIDWWDELMKRRGWLITCILPVSTPFTTTIDIQISYISGVKSSPSYSR
jgi:hypothetical protein